MIDRVNRKVFFRMPLYDGKLDADAMMTAGRAGDCLNDGFYTRQIDCQSTSALCCNFNMLWCEALNGRAKHGWTEFAMLHADMATIIPKWLDWLIDERQRHDCDLLSVVASIKTEHGLTNCGAMDGEGNVKRFTLSQIRQMPLTFGIEDTPYPNCTLVVNTGMWTCDFTKPWVEKVHFQTIDKIIPPDDSGGVYRTYFRPEDWEFSRMLTDLGVRIKCTSALPTRHSGRMSWPSEGKYGLLVDPQSVSE